MCHSKVGVKFGSVSINNNLVSNKLASYFGLCKMFGRSDKKNSHSLHLNMMNQIDYFNRIWVRCTKAYILGN